MSSSGSSRCSLCLQFLSHTVTLPCGHSSCPGCLSQYWSQGLDRAQSWRCPQCGFNFGPGTAAPAPGPSPGPVLQGLVQGVGVMSLKPSAPPLGSFDHATFDISSVHERNDGERLLGEAQQSLAQQISLKESEHQQLQHSMKEFPRVVKTALKDSARIFSELLDFVEQRRVEMKALIRAQEKAELARAENHLQRLEQEISELQRRRASQEQGVIREKFTVPASARSPVVNPHVSFGPVRKSLLELKQQLESLYLQEFPTVAKEVKSVSFLQMEPPSKGAFESVPLPAMDNRDDVLQYLCPVSVDPFSVHRELSLSECNRVVSRQGALHSYPDHPERFDRWTQALSHQGLAGRSYWEAEWAGSQVALGVAYHSIGRKGSSDSSRLGHNSVSWSLKCAPSSFSFCHGASERPVVVPESSLSRRIAVFLDHDRGLLCFFSVAGKRLHLLHRLENRFTEPLFAAVWVGNNSSVDFRD